MFLIGSPGREVNSLRVEAAEAPQLVLKAHTLPSQEIAYHLNLKWDSYSLLLMCNLSIQACRRVRVCKAVILRRLDGSTELAEVRARRSQAQDDYPAPQPEQ
jgi:hypothetical protein